MNKVVRSIRDGGATGTVWLSLLTIAASIASLPDVLAVIPPLALPYIVIFIGLCQGAKRLFFPTEGCVGWKSLTVWMSAIQVFLGVLALPTWGQIVPPEGLAVLASVSAAITWWKRIFFPTGAFPTEEPGINSPPDVYLDEQGRPLQTVRGRKE